MSQQRPAHLFWSKMMTKPSEKLEQMGITLPAVPKPVASYVPCVRRGDLLMLSGQIPLRDGKLAFVGLAGHDQPLEAAQEAARLCALNAIAVGADAAGGIENIERVLKVVVYVASPDGFTDQHLVANGASDFIKEVFGDAGIHARAAVGVAGLPLNATVEIDVTFALAST
jgi:enamine deaminase RidA (YjgF/YER057c/UK114 family)